MPAKPAAQTLTFHAPLESISEKMAYFAFTVPKKTSQALQTKGPVPVRVLLNDAVTFLVSLAPIGGGRHWLRVNAKAWKAAKLQEGDRVKVQITVVDRAAELSVPKDLTAALRAAGSLENFAAVPLGQMTFMIRLINAAAKPETRAKRIAAAVAEAKRRAAR
jgi:hypothetical protein